MCVSGHNVVFLMRAIGDESLKKFMNCVFASPRVVQLTNVVRLTWRKSILLTLLVWMHKQRGVLLLSQDIYTARQISTHLHILYYYT